MCIRDRFGAGHELTHFKPLSQPGQYACEEKVDLVGPKGTIKGVRAVSYTHLGKKQTNIYPIIGKILSQDSIGAYCNENKLNYKEIKNYIYYKIKDSKSVIGYIVCANSPNYTEDDLNILSIFAKQLSVALKLYEYNLVEIKHKIRCV